MSVCRWLTKNKNGLMWIFSDDQVDMVRATPFARCVCVCVCFGVCSVCFSRNEDVPLAPLTKYVFCFMLFFLFMETVFLLVRIQRLHVHNGCMCLLYTETVFFFLVVFVRKQLEDLDLSDPASMLCDFAFGVLCVVCCTCVFAAIAAVIYDEAYAGSRAAVGSVCFFFAVVGSV